MWKQLLIYIMIIGITSGVSIRFATRELTHYHVGVALEQAKEAQEKMKKYSIDKETQGDLLKSILRIRERIALSNTRKHLEQIADLVIGISTLSGVCWLALLWTSRVESKPPT